MVELNFNQKKNQNHKVDRLGRRFKATADASLAMQRCGISWNWALVLVTLSVAASTVGRPVRSRVGEGGGGAIPAWHVPCKKWDEHAALINTDMQQRVREAGGGRIGVHPGEEMRSRTRLGHSIFGLAILTRPRMSLSSMPFFGVALGSVAGQGAFTGPIHVAYTGDAEGTRYVGRAASAWQVTARVVTHVNIKTQKGRRTAALDTSASSKNGMHLANFASRTSGTNAAAANYLHALEIDYAASRTDGAQDQNHATNDQPVVLLDDDLIVSTIFELRLNGLLQGIARKMPRKQHYVLSLYVVHPLVNEWARLSPGVVEYPVEHFRETKALVFSDKHVRTFVAQCFRKTCLSAFSSPAATTHDCPDVDAILKACLEAQHDIRLFGLQHSIVQRNIPETQKERFGNGQPLEPAAKDEQKRAANYVDMRRPCLDILRTAWI